MPRLSEVSRSQDSRSSAARRHEAPRASNPDSESAIDTYYAERDGDPIWIQYQRISRDAQDLIGVLEQSWMNGLNPEKYHLNQIHELLDDGRRVHPDSLIMLELLITDAYVEYIRDLSGMRINAYDMGLNPKHWNQSSKVTLGRSSCFSSIRDKSWNN